MKIEFTFDNITQLEELYYAVENIPSEILEDEKELGTPVKEEQQLYEVIMKLKSKRISDEYVKIPLTAVQILHFKLLYYIVYAKKNYPNKLSKFNFSEDLSELLDNENKIRSLYKEIKQNISN